MSILVITYLSIFGIKSVADKMISSVREFSGPCVNNQDSQVWFDDFCNKYQCVNKNGTNVVQVFSCTEPVPPPDEVACHDIVGNKNLIYPYCCPKLPCVTTDDDDWLSQLSEENVTSHLHRNVQKREVKKKEKKEYSAVSAEEDDDEETEDDDLAAKGDDEEPTGEIPEEYQEGLDEAKEQRTLLDWLLWPLEVIMFSESELLRIFRTRDEWFHNFGQWHRKNQ